jgi:hypothetical protein
VTATLAHAGCDGIDLVWEDGGCRIGHAHPVILVCEELLDDLAAPGYRPPLGLESRLDRPPRMRIMLWTDPVIIPDHPVIMEADGRARVDWYTGAVWRLRDADRRLVYKVTGYEGNRVWRAAWPD